jgi:hypothetical protein
MKNKIEKYKSVSWQMQSSQENKPVGLIW